MPINLEKKELITENYEPKGEELLVEEYLKERIPVLKDTKKNVLGYFDYDQLMKDADREYIPHNLKENKSTSVMLVQDEIKGLRGSRVVPIGDTKEDWRSDVSEPVLMEKVQTALSILFNENPGAKFDPLSKKFKKNNEFIKGLWQRSWKVAKSKHQMKNIIFDLANYGWAIGRTYPRFIQRKGKILTEVNDDHPEQNKYKDVNITQYNDLFRERLDPKRTWIDDMTNLMDPWSCNDWYYEKDYSWDAFLTEFGDYKNIKHVKKGGKVQEEDDSSETINRSDIITVGFYESIDKDLYAIRIPAQNVTLFYSPLPNDKKKLSCWWTYWNIRNPKTPYGIGIYEIIRNDKVLYDRIRNMTVDQMVMAIYPMLFYSGAGALQNDGTMTISPAKIQQKTPGTTIDQIDIKFDPRGWDSVAKIKEDIDEITGITPTLQGEIEGKTLGETLHAKDSALKRLSTPLKNIAEMLENEAYLSLAWMPQIYSIPEVMNFKTQEEIEEYQEQTGRVAQNVTASETNEEGQPTNIQADFYPSFKMNLEDKDGTLFESKEERFFTLNDDISLAGLEWEGMISIEINSLISPTPELERQRKLELFNLVEPVVEKISMAIKQDVDIAIALTKPLIQILEIQDEKPKLWLPDEIIKAMENPEAYKAELQAKLQAEQQQMMQTQQTQEMSKPENMPLFVKGGQEAETVVPRGQVSNDLRNPIGQMGSQQNG